MNGDLSGTSDTYEWSHYLIHKTPIGRGTYSKVYHGIHKETKREVALKKILFSKLHNTIKDKVVSEIQILQQMNHEHIMKLYEYKFEGEYIFLVTEYCNNQDLDHWIKTNPPLAQMESIMRQIACGMEYLHGQHILHRDIKPQNILLHHGKIKICDFGFATMIKEQQQLFHTVCGTPLFMSPELLLAKPYTAKSDIWSLGILFYMMVYHVHPFGPLKTLEEYRYKITRSILCPPLDDTEYLSDLIQLMLSYKPPDRPDIHMIHRSLQLKHVDPMNVFETIPLEDHSNTKPDPEQRIMELEDHIFKLESILKEKEPSRSFCCFTTEDRETDVTGRGRTNNGYEHNYSHLDKDYFTPPMDGISQAIRIPSKKPESKSSSLSSSFGTFFNLLTQSFSK